MARSTSTSKVSTQASAVATEAESADPAPLPASQLIDFYRLMYASRRIDDREIMLKRQQIAVRLLDQFARFDQELFKKFVHAGFGPHSSVT